MCMHVLMFVFVFVFGNQVYHILNFTLCTTRIMPEKIDRKLDQESEYDRERKQHTENSFQFCHSHKHIHTERQTRKILVTEPGKCSSFVSACAPACVYECLFRFSSDFLLLCLH